MTSQAIPTQGTTVEVDIASTATVVSEVSSISPVGETTNLIDVTSLSSLAREYIGGLQDGTEVTIEGNRVKNDAGQEHLRDNIGATMVFVITLSNGDTISYNAVNLEYNTAGIGVEDKVMFSNRVKITGDITYTEASP